MSWLFSRAQVEASLAPHCSGTELSALLSGIPIAQAYWSRGRQTDPYDLSQFGMTCERLTEDLGAELLTWFRAGFHAKPTAAHLEGALWRTISGRKCGASWQMSLPGTYSPRTPKDAQSTERPTNSSRWVTPSDAQLYPRRTWVLTTYGSDIGYLHTPTCTANYSAPSMQKHPCARAFSRVFGKPSRIAHEWLMGWPTNWTLLEPRGTDKSRSAPQLLGECSRDVKTVSA
jgi:hypothetical protein